MRGRSSISAFKKHPPLEIRQSPIAGLGAFATRPIRDGSRIIEYAGERITPTEADERYSGVSSAHEPVLLFTVGAEIVIDAGVNGNQARYLNHSCEPNCEAIIEGRRIWIYAIRDIEPGEELTYDYNLTGDDEPEAQATQYPCHCGTASCRGTLYRVAPHDPGSPAAPLG